MPSLFKRLNTRVHKKAAPSPKDPYPHISKSSTDPTDAWLTLGEIGDGAFGKVYRVKDRKSNLTAAAKIIPVNDDDLKEHYTEIDILSRASTDHIIKLHSAVLFNGKLWILLELCEGGALDDIIENIEHGLSEEQISACLFQTLQGLRYLHNELLVIHRDLKAGNLLITPDGLVKLADFGVSARLRKADERRNTFIGTPFWMAPEVINCETFKDEGYTMNCDVWSLGITLIELADMEPPHSEVNPARVTLRILKSDPPTLDRPKKWSKEFNDFLKKLLVKDAKRRQNINDVIEANHVFFKHHVQFAKK